MLEMALARNPQVRKHVLKIDTCKQGFDFYFMSLTHAQTFSSYLARIAPMRIKTTTKMVSADVKNNTANMKYTVACDMVPLCRDDLIIVHKSAKGILSGRLCCVTKVSSVVHLVDASPKRSSVMDGALAEVAPETYYKSGGEKLYRVVSSSRRLIRYVVLDVELCQDGQNGEYQKHDGTDSKVNKFALADVEVARETDFGNSDETFRCVTHLGNLLQVGDIMLGYDLTSAVLSSAAEWSMDRSFNAHFTMPDVVLVKKVLGVEKEEQEEKKRAKSSASKKRERRRNKEEKKMRDLAEAAERMGFLETEELDQNQFDRELLNDPDLAEELVAAERELAVIDDGGAEDVEDKRVP
jgi:nonsense-mediated mRNA decay protein 3